MLKIFIESDQLFAAEEQDLSCVCCKGFDYGDEDEPISFLDSETQLCQSCFNEIKMEIYCDECGCSFGCERCLL